MTDREFKRLSRSQLIEIIYQFQLKQDELIAENERLSKELADKRLRIAQAGNIAEAALAVNGVMQAAQDAAQQYLDEIRAMHSELDAECQGIRKKAVEEAAMIIARARKEAAAIQGKPTKAAAVPAVPEEKKEAKVVAPAKTDSRNDVTLEAILSEFGSMSEL